MALSPTATGKWSLLTTNELGRTPPALDENTASQYLIKQRAKNLVMAEPSWQKLWAN